MPTPLPPSPFMFDPDQRFVLDVEKFMAAIMPRHVTVMPSFSDDRAPAFLSSPRPEFMRAADFAEVTNLLSSFARSRRSYPSLRLVGALG
jgi:hypothetical protein